MLILCLVQPFSPEKVDDDPLSSLHASAIAAHRAKRHSEALEQITAAIMLVYDKEQSTVPRSAASSNLFNSKGVIHKGAHDFPSALLAFDLAAELDDTGTNYNALYNRANTMHYNIFNQVELGDKDKIRSVSEAFSSSPARRGFTGQLHEQLLEAAALDYASADEILRTNFDPGYDYASFANDYALCLRRLGNTNAAIEVLLRGERRLFVFIYFLG